LIRGLKRWWRRNFGQGLEGNFLGHDVEVGIGQSDVCVDEIFL
jgi:hypothetical protein